MTRTQLDTRNGEYVLGDLLGRGGMGQVHAARHSSGRRVVVKRLRNTVALDARIAARFGDEGRVSRRVNHPNVVRVFDHGTSADGTPYIVMEHARGTTLRKLVLQEGTLPLSRIRGLVAQLLCGLTAIHRAGIVHADIKSNNLIVDTASGVDHLTIIDFGLARTRTSEAVFDDGLVAGTPEYMAPEVCRGAQPTAAADIYSAGVVAYELLVGATPFAGDHPLDVLQRQLTDPIEFPADARDVISPELERVLRRALEKHPVARFPDARSFAIAFERAISPLVRDEPAVRPAEVAVSLTDLEPCGEPETPAVLERRRELYDVLDGGAPDPIIVAYLGLADALIADNRMLAAVQELEGALLLLVPKQGQPPRSLWRIESLLAAMYERLGNPVRARRAAMDAHDHAARAACPIGTARTRSLMRRLLATRTAAPPPGELAAGSGAHDRARTTPLRVRSWLEPANADAPAPDAPATRRR